MTISINVTNPAEHDPAELRLVAHFLQTFAADMESGKIARTMVGQLVWEDQLPKVEQEQTEDAPKPQAAHSPADAEPSTTAPNENSDTFDVNGLPYDGRIHSSTRAKLANGAWKYKRGVDKSLIDEVEAELKQLAKGGPVDAGAVAVERDEPEQFHPTYTARNSEQFTQAPPPPPPAPAAEDVPPPPAPAAPAAVTAADIFKKVTALQTAGKLPADDLKFILGQFEPGCTSVMAAVKLTDRLGDLLGMLNQVDA